MTSLISAENVWGLWAILIGVAALSIWAEDRYRWAAKLTGCVLALSGTMILANINVIPTESQVYDNVWTYVVPLAIPLLLFQCNIKKIGKESGRLLILFVLSSLGTVLGAVCGYLLLYNLIPELEVVAAMFTATYVGGSVNFASMAESFQATGELASTAVVADNLLMAVYFFVLIAIPGMTFFRKYYKAPLVEEIEINQKKKTKESYWKAKEIALKDIAFAVAVSTAIVAISTEVANVFANIGTIAGFGFVISQLLGNKYLIMTTITMICATAFPKVFGEAPGANEIGMFLIYIFFAVIGAPASIVLIITESPLLLLYALIIVTANMLVTFIFGKLFHFHLEEIILASNANVGGPTTAAAMAISKGWNVLVGPVLLIGTLGYVLGNYYGIILGHFLIG